MGVVFNGVVYLSGYILLMFIAVCLASGLYYLAELVEEHTSLTRRIMIGCNVLVLLVHVLFLVFETLPLMALGVGFAAHACYLWLLQSFPFIRIRSPPFAASFCMLLATHYFWASHFMNHYHGMTHVVCFFVLNVWLVPFGFFISLSVNESTLPDRQMSKAGGSFSLGKSF